MRIKRELFGKTPEGAEITRFTVSNDNRITASFIDFGAILTSVRLPNRNGNIQEVTLGFDTLDDYISDVWFFGATIGRYANRISQGRFTLDGVQYQLAQNSFPSHLHGGNKGFHKVVWKPETLVNQDSIGITFSYVSQDGEEGYPGNFAARVTYALNNQNELIITYSAEADRATPVNLTNHTYWNLRGAGSGKALDHILTLNADHYLPTDGDRIPTGEIKTVLNTPMDFTHSTKIGSRIDQVNGGGYNHCYVLNKQGHTPSLAAIVHEPKSRRAMAVYTTEPGIQFYSGHFLNNCRGAAGVPFNQFDGFCLEAQHFPNSVNQPHFPSTILMADEIYGQTTIHKFFSS